MGFGSYDESEQDDGEQEIDTESTVTVENADAEGSVEFESEESTEELVDRLQEMKD